MSDDIVSEFLVESAENLDSLDRELIRLEKEPGDSAMLSSVFRTIHTIKGTCGFLGFTKLESVAHVGENLLSRLRDGEITLNPEITTALLQMVDAIRQMLQSIEATGSEGERNDEALIQTLTNLQQSGATSPPEYLKQEVLGPVAMAPKDLPVAPKVEAKEDHTDSREPPHQETAETMQTQSPNRAGVSDASIRVDVGLLDKLMNLVGELVLARNQILQFTNTTEDPGLVAPSQRLNLITTELQEGVMKTRMQPIGNIWSKFPRTVRDVATTCGKQIRLEMVGKETELDKTIIEAIKDPITHIVRNSADHGIETPAARMAAGKSTKNKTRSGREPTWKPKSNSIAASSIASST